MAAARLFSHVKTTVSRTNIRVNFGAAALQRSSALRRQINFNSSSKTRDDIQKMLFSSSALLHDGIIPVMGDNSKTIEDADGTLARAAQISKEDYDEIADKTMDSLSSTLEDVQEQKGSIDTEYSVRIQFNIQLSIS